MAEKIVIEVYKTKAPEELTKLLSEPDSRLDTGSAAALTAASAVALMKRAAAVTAEKTGGSERLDYILRNLETMRAYMVHLIDEDVKSRAPLRKAMQEGNEQHIEASLQTASCIPAEVVNMMGQCLELMAELIELCQDEAVQYIASGAELAMGVIKSGMIYVVGMSKRSVDETYRFVVRRENELTYQHCTEVFGGIMDKVKGRI